MEVAIMASLFAEGYMKIKSWHYTPGFLSESKVERTRGFTQLVNN